MNSYEHIVVDENTDRSDTVKLLTLIRDVDKFDAINELFSMEAVKGTTSREDFYERLSTNS
jgi:hypothetical protein